MLSPSRSPYSVRPSRAMWLPVLAFGAIVFLGSRPASAQVTTSYGGSSCQPAAVHWTAFSFPMDGGIKATSTGGGGWVICPITKYTSGVGVEWGDELADVKVTLNNNGGSTGIYCQTVVYSSSVPSSSSSDTNVQYWGWSQTETSDTQIDWSDGIEGSGYWQDTSWYYAQLECLLQNSEEVTSYEVTENGGYTGQIISPVSAGCFTGSSSNHFQTEPADTLETWNGEGPVGWAEAAGGDPVKYDCDTPLSYYQYSVIPTINNASAWEWAFNTSGFGSPASWTCTYSGGSPDPITGPAHQVFPGSSTYEPGPSAIFPSSTYVPPSADEYVEFTGEGEWLVTTSTTYVFFDQCTTDGDWGLVSYRSSD
jgi:hypothetical protein